METVVRRSRLTAEPEAVWQHATSLEGISLELRPWMRMTAPPGIRDLTSEPPIGEPWFHSWVLMFGVLPVERVHLQLTVLDIENRRFVEESTLLWMKGWRHERFVEALEGGCALEDRLTPESRIPGGGPMVRRIIGALFDHRHRMLRRTFGELP